MRLVSTLAAAAGSEQVLILCPFLAGLDSSVGMWLGPLAWQDCNAQLLASLASPVATGSTIFAAVFGADPFEPWDDLLSTLQRCGVVGVANLPSISFFDGEFADTLRAMNLGMERELAFLRYASSRGFRIAGCAREFGDAQAMLGLGAEFVITHAGPPIAVGSRERVAECQRLTRDLRRNRAQALPLSELLT